MNYRWQYNSTVFHSLVNLSPAHLLSEEEWPPLDQSKPHAIGYAVDSTPFNGQTIRTSVFKTVAFLAMLAHIKPEHSHLDYFSVTVISFWNWQVRIVQGLVHFKSRDMDLRVSPVQDFQNGFRGEDGSIDPRFLKLLGYNCGESFLLSRK